MNVYDLVVIGGGPAGCAAAITAARCGGHVLLLERGRYPRHKVCGEFISPESHHLLTSLLLDDDMNLLTGAPVIRSARIFLDRSIIETRLSPPAISISRWNLDAALWRSCPRADVDAQQGVTVERLEAAGDATPAAVHTSAGEFASRCVIDATGRWSNLLKNRASDDVPQKRWLGLKAHFAEERSPDSSDLYFFPAGYCGIQPVGRGTVNVCAMVRSDTCTSLNSVFEQTPELKARSRGWQPRSEPVSTFPLVFRKPHPESGGVLYAGDAAGFIDPFVGDGISLALASGALAAQCLSGTWKGEYDLAQAAALYATQYRRRFLPALRNAAVVRRLFNLPIPLRSLAVRMAGIPAVSRKLVNLTRAA